MFEHEIDKNINIGTPPASYYFGVFKKYPGIENDAVKHNINKSVFKIKKKTKEDKLKWLERETGLIRINKNNIFVIEEKWWMKIFRKILKL